MTNLERWIEQGIKPKVKASLIQKNGFHRSVEMRELTQYIKIAELGEFHPVSFVKNDASEIQNINVREIIFVHVRHKIVQQSKSAPPIIFAVYKEFE